MEKGHNRRSHNYEEVMGTCQEACEQQDQIANLCEGPFPLRKDGTDVWTLYSCSLSLFCVVLLSSAEAPAL